MEMVQISTTPQEVLSPILAMAAGSSAPAKPAQGGGDPLLFAALLREMLPPVPAAAGTEPTDAAKQQVATGKGAVPGKSKSGMNSAVGPAEQANGADVEETLAALGGQLAQLSAMVIRMPEEEFRPQPGDPEQTARPLQNGEIGSDVMQAGIEPASTVPLALKKLRDALSPSGTPEEPDVLPSPRQFRRTTGREAVGENVPPAITSVTPAKTAASTVSLTSEALDKVPKSPLPPGGGGSGWGGSLQDLSRLRLHPPPNPLPSREGGETFARGSSEMLFEAAPQGATVGESTTPDTNRITAVAGRPLLLGGELPVPEGRAPLPTRGIGGAGSPAEAIVEVVFADPSSKGGFHEGEMNGKSGAKEKGDKSIAGPGIAPPHDFALPEPSRAAIQPKGDEAGRALHESILAQVRESVVSHDGKGNGRITVRLNPVELGELQVNVRIENHQVKVEIITDNRAVRDALMGNIDSLKETLLKQNLTMERFDVSTGGGNGFNQGFSDERGGERYASRLPFGQAAAPLEVPVGRGVEEWGVAQNSLVDLRL